MEQKSKIIGTEEYLVTQMDAVSALRIQTKIIKLLGAGAADLLDDSKPAADKLKDIIPKLMNNFDDEIVNDIVLALFKKGVFIKSGDVPKKIDFATHFAGKAMHMWKVVGFILEVNFALGEE